MILIANLSLPLRCTPQKPSQDFKIVYLGSVAPLKLEKYNSDKKSPCKHSVAQWIQATRDFQLC